MVYKSDSGRFMKRLLKDETQFSSRPEQSHSLRTPLGSVGVTVHKQRLTAPSIFSSPKECLLILSVPRQPGIKSVLPPSLPTVTKLAPSSYDISSETLCTTFRKLLRERML